MHQLPRNSHIARSHGTLMFALVAMCLVLFACERSTNHEAAATQKVVVQKINNADTSNLEAMRKACDVGEEQACTRLGNLYSQGLTVTQNDATAVTAWQKGCDGGDSLSCANLSVAFLLGLGVSRDEAMADRLWRRSCVDESMLCAVPHSTPTPPDAGTSSEWISACLDCADPHWRLH